MGGACRIMDFCSAGAEGMDFESFLSIFTRGVFGSHDSPTDALVVARSIFNSYDTNRDQVLDRQECLNLFADVGSSGKMDQDPDGFVAESQNGQAASGPLDFDQFVSLMRRLIIKDESRN